MIAMLVIAEEKKEVEHRRSIGEFDRSSLKRQNTQEKIVLPNKEGKGRPTRSHMFMYLSSCFHWETCYH